MADTRQVVNWSLERKCVFRNGEDWFLPRNTLLQLADMRTVAGAYDADRVVDGVCVTSWTSGWDRAGDSFDIPCSGFRIADRLRNNGGLADVERTCGECDANARTKNGKAIAGCYGYLDVWPDSKELDELLWKKLEERKLEESLRTAFQVTRPLWFGFWMNSPLRRPQTRLLLELFDDTFDDEDRERCNFDHFLAALRCAVDWELPIHVSLEPLGHVDFGWHTVFPHCPRCKANARVGRWKDKYPTEERVCAVCGSTFVPDETRSQEREDHDFEARSLERQLGKPGADAFVRRYLEHQGCTERQIEEIIDNERNGPVLRRVAAARRDQRLTRKSLRREEEPSASPQDLPTCLRFELADGVPLELVLIPSGEFLMGSPDSEDGHADNEAPRHLVSIARPFYMGRFPITQRQWIAMTGKNPSKRRGRDDLPVDRVSWFDCIEFCNRLSHRFERLFRLPSEAEWEYACRAGTTSAFAFGDELLKEHANFIPLADLLEHSDSRCGTTPVGSFEPNAWGLYDMHGNVEEWCDDVWHDTYEGVPVDGSPWLKDEDGQAFRVVRGGWCSATGAVCRSASRRMLRADGGGRDNDPDDDDDKFVSSIAAMIFTPYGFRVVCETV